MKAGEAKAFGGFTLGVFAPRKGKVSSCPSGYSKQSFSSTLQGCFLECAQNPQCSNVLLRGELPNYMEKPGPIVCTLVGHVNPSDCDPGECNSSTDPEKCQTLVTHLQHARRCAELWPSPTSAAIGAPNV